MRKNIAVTGNFVSSKKMMQVMVWWRHAPMPHLGVFFEWGLPFWFSANSRRKESSTKRVSQRAIIMDGWCITQAAHTWWYYTLWCCAAEGEAADGGGEAADAI
jgi:hypothetical protein